MSNQHNGSTHVPPSPAFIPLNKDFPTPLSRNHRDFCASINFSSRVIKGRRSEFYVATYGNGGTFNDFGKLDVASWPKDPTIALDPFSSSERIRMGTCTETPDGAPAINYLPGSPVESRGGTRYAFMVHARKVAIPGGKCFRMSIRLLRYYGEEEPSQPAALESLDRAL